MHGAFELIIAAERGAREIRKEERSESGTRYFCKHPKLGI